MHFPLYDNSVETTGPASQLQHHLPSSRLTLTPASTTRPNDPEMLQSALKLVNSLNSKRGHRNASVRSKYQGLPNERSASGTLPYRDARLAADQTTENTRGPHWLRSALLTPAKGLLSGIHAPFETFAPPERFGNLDAINQQAALRSPSSHSQLLHADCRARSEEPEPEFLSDLRPITTSDPAAFSPPPTPSSFRPSGFDSLIGEAADSSWTEWEAEATEHVRSDLDTRQFWTKHAAPTVAPPKILLPERDTFSAQLERESLPQYAMSPSGLVGLMDDGQYSYDDDHGLTINPALMFASTQGGDQDQDLHLFGMQSESGAMHNSSSPAPQNNSGNISAGSDTFSPHVRPFLPPASSPFCGQPATGMSDGKSHTDGLFAQNNHHESDASYGDSDDYLYDEVDDSFFEFLDVTTDMKGFSTPSSHLDATMADSSF